MRRRLPDLFSYDTRLTVPTAARDTQTQTLIFFAFIVSLSVSMCVSLVLPHLGFAAKWGGSGHDGYLELASNLLAGNGFRFDADGPYVFHRPPLYPALLAPVMLFDVTGQKVGVAVLNSVFFSITCLYLLRITRLLYSHNTVGVVAIGLVMLNPWIYRLISSPLSAIMQMCLSTALCFYVLRFCLEYQRIASLSWRQLASSYARLALLTSALCYAHGTSLYVCSALFLAVLTTTVATRAWRLSAMTVALALVTVLAISPWAQRNASLLGRAEPVTSGAGYTYFLGNQYWGLTEIAATAAEDKSRVALLDGGIDAPRDDMVSYWGVVDPAVDNHMKHAMVEHIASHPVSVLKKSALNLSDIFFPVTHVIWCANGGQSQYCNETLSSYQTASRVARTLYMLAVIGLAVFSVFGGSRAGWWFPGLALMTAGLYSVPYLPIATYAHHGIYSLSVLPVVCVLAAAALSRAWSWRTPVSVSL